MTLRVSVRNNLISPDEINRRAKRGRRERWKEEREAYERERPQTPFTPRHVSRSI